MTEMRSSHLDGWVLPPWAETPPTSEAPAACRSCGAQVLWVLTTKGRRAPLNPDGTSHFATCPQADTWRKRHDASSAGAEERAAQASEFIDQSFRDRISWTAARVLLERTVPILEDHEAAQLHVRQDSRELREAIVRFLERHPSPPANRPEVPSQPDGQGDG